MNEQLKKVIESAKKLSDQVDKYVILQTTRTCLLNAKQDLDKQLSLLKES